MNVNGKYLKDENGNIISPIVSASTIYDIYGTNLQSILYRIPHIFDGLNEYENWDSVVTNTLHQCIKFTNVYDAVFYKKGAPTNSYTYGLLISIITTCDHSNTGNYTNIQIYLPDTHFHYIYYRTFNQPNMNVWNIIKVDDYTPSYGYGS